MEAAKLVGPRELATVGIAGGTKRTNSCPRHCRVDVNARLGNGGSVFPHDTTREIRISPGGAHAPRQKRDRVYCHRQDPRADENRAIHLRPRDQMPISQRSHQKHRPSQSGRPDPSTPESRRGLCWEPRVMDPRAFSSGTLRPYSSGGSCQEHRGGRQVKPRKHGAEFCETILGLDE